MSTESVKVFLGVLMPVLLLSLLVAGGVIAVYGIDPLKQPPGVRLGLRYWSCAFIPLMLAATAGMFLVGWW